MRTRFLRLRREGEVERTKGRDQDCLDGINVVMSPVRVVISAINLLCPEGVQ